MLYQIGYHPKAIDRPMCWLLEWFERSRRRWSKCRWWWRRRPTMHRETSKRMEIGFWRYRSRWRQQQWREWRSWYVWTRWSEGKTNALVKAGFCAVQLSYWSLTYPKWQRCAIFSELETNKAIQKQAPESCTYKTHMDSCKPLWEGHVSQNHRLLWVSDLRDIQGKRWE